MLFKKMLAPRNSMEDEGKYHFQMLPKVLCTAPRYCVLYQGTVSVLPLAVSITDWDPPLVPEAANIQGSGEADMIGINWCLGQELSHQKIEC